ncbi:GNAT family N-acetyltransferase, partial [Streptomyces stramineus]|uniref:GNAT family N-acetyltransferase n=1 Tax=Streptomyces stramineus TaxID=173861 RepID=UPI0031DB533C
MVRIRNMTEADAAAVAAIRVGGWRAAYAGLLPRAHLDALDVARETELRREHLRAAGEHVVNLVAEEEGRTEGVLGWACYGPSRDDDRPEGVAELYALYVRPDRIGTGVGRALCAAAVGAAAGRGFRAMRLWVVEGNARARAFYERAGFTADGAEAADDAGGAAVPEMRYARALAGAGR